MIANLVTPVIPATKSAGFIMSRKQLYWICQIAGWATYSLSELLLYSFRFGYSDSLIINALVTLVLGIVVTHCYRLIIKNLSWLDLPLAKLVPRIISSVLFMGFIMLIFSLLLDYLTVPNIRESILERGIPLYFIMGGYLNMCKHALLWSLLYHVFQYFERSKKNEVERLKLEASVKDFEAKMLRAQLNPHFMFNSLNSIRALVIENPEKAQVSVTRLSNLLRNCLVADRQKTVTLGEELKTVQDYLSLEKIRYEDRLDVRTDIKPESLSVQVPPMMVQTLVENAVKHGISKPLKGGFISIESRMENNYLNLAIRNTGVLGHTDSGGFGLINTSQRLGLIYGPTASFQISQETEDVVCARIILPVQ
jgi:sensor histidine kinase YesM